MPTAGSQDQGSKDRSSQRSRRYASWAGLASGIGFAVGNAIWALGMPSAGAPVADVLAFYDDRAVRIIIGGSLSLLAIAAFLLFAAASCQILRRAGADETLTTTALGGAALLAALGISAESINMAAAMRSRDGDLDQPLARALFEVSQSFGSTASGIGLAIFAAAFGVAGLQCKALKPWRLWTVLVTGGLLLTPLVMINVLPGIAMILVSLTIAFGFTRRAEPPAHNSAKASSESQEGDPDALGV